MAVRKALVVDDSKSARFALRKFLEGRDFEVDTAESADEALRYLKATQPSVVFLDHVMPGLDGFQALSAMREDPGTAEIPVVICSSNDDENFVREATERGAIGVMHKPPSARKLSELIKELKPLEPTAPEPAEPDSPDKELGDAASRIETAVLASVRASLPTEPESGADLESLAKRIDALERSLGERLDALAGRMDALESSLARHPDIDHVRDLAREECDALRINLKDEIGALKSAKDSAPGFDELRAQIDELRTCLDSAGAASPGPRDELIQAARRAAAVEAADVATRTVMNASSKIADRLAESIVASLERKKG